MTYSASSSAALREPHRPLTLDRFGVAYDEHIVLADINFALPERGVVALMGPGGAGKSTLLRTLSGANDGQPSLRMWGEVTYLGRPLSEHNRPKLVEQKARLLLSTAHENVAAALPDRSSLTQAEQRARIGELLTTHGAEDLIPALEKRVVGFSLIDQRRLAIIRTVATSPAVLLVDEVTADLEPSHVEVVLDLLLSISRSRTVLFATHNQQHARRACSEVILLGGGKIIAHQPVDAFFETPDGDIAATYVRTGSASLPSPNAKPEDLAEDAPEPARPRAPLPPVSEFVGPRGFRWLEAGRLAGCPRPGIVREAETDIEALRRVGVDVLVTLEERATVDGDILSRFDIESVFFPIDDMHAPAAQACWDLCGRVEAWLSAGRCIAYHCRAGHGRTGTMLAAQLIFRGLGAVEAVDRVRSVEPRWIQSDIQLDFLEELAKRNKHLP